MQQNTTRSAELSLNEEGNYSCVATSYYGTIIRVIPVVIIGKTMFFYLLSLAANLPIIQKMRHFETPFWIMINSWAAWRVYKF